MVIFITLVATYPVKEQSNAIEEENTSGIEELDMEETKYGGYKGGGYKNGGGQVKVVKVAVIKVQGGGKKMCHCHGK